MTAYIVCEGQRDAQLFKRLLPTESTNSVEVVAAGGISAVKSLARSLVVRRQSPVAVVIDADVVVQEQVEQRLKEIEELIGSIAANTPVKVILPVPTLESIFFKDVSLLTNLLGHIPSQDMLDLAIYEPAQVLRQLIEQSDKVKDWTDLINQLTDEQIKTLLQVPIMQELVQFLQSGRESANILT